MLVTERASIQYFVDLRTKSYIRLPIYTLSLVTTLQRRRNVATTLLERGRIMSRGALFEVIRKVACAQISKCEWYCERSLSNMRNTIRMLLICAHATLRMISNKAPQELRGNVPATEELFPILVATT
jgi:hypothetical protein